MLEDLRSSAGDESVHDRISIFNNYDKIKNESFQVRNPFSQRAISVTSEKFDDDISFSPSVDSSFKTSFNKIEEKMEFKSNDKLDLSHLGKADPLLNNSPSPNDSRREFPKLMLSPAQENGISYKPQTIFEQDNSPTHSKILAGEIQIVRKI